MTRFRVPMEKVDTEQSSVGWGSQVSALAAASVFLLLLGSGAWLTQAVNAESLSAKGNAPLTTGPDANQSALRARFLKAIDTSLRSAGVESVANEAAGTLRLGPRSVSFKLGQAWLMGRPLEHIDLVGAVLAKAAACLPKSTATYAAPSVLDSRPGTQACTPPEILSEVSFACAPEFAQLKLDSVLVEGHADARPYSVPGRQFKDNLNLSSARGETVLRRLYACTPELAALANPQGEPLVSLGAHSTQRPAAADDPQGEANRRVEFRFVLDTRQSAQSSALPTQSSAVGASEDESTEDEASLPAAEGDDDVILPEE